MANRFEQFTPMEVQTLERALRLLPGWEYQVADDLYKEVRAQREIIEEEWKDKHYAG